MKFRLDRTTLLTFLAWDAVAIAIHVAYGLAVFRNPQTNWPEFLNVGRDWSLGEIGNYVKWIIIIFALASAYSKSRVLGTLALAVLFLDCLLDDSLQLHERGGAALVQHGLFGNAFAQDQQEAGELVTWTALGVFCAVFLRVSWSSASTSERQKMMPALVLFSGIFVCAVVFDLFHSLVQGQSVIAGILGLLEDGGEMIFLTLLVAYIRGAY